MKRLAISLALTCVLSASAMAVDMPTCGLQSSDEIPSTGYASGDSGNQISPAGTSQDPTNQVPATGIEPGNNWSILLTLIDLAF